MSRKHSDGSHNASDPSAAHSSAAQHAHRSGLWLVGGTLLALLAIVIIIVGIVTVSYTHLTLPTIYSV